MKTLEEHARTAASDAHESVTSLVVPDLGAGPGRPVAGRFALALAAVVLLGGLIALWPKDSDVDVITSDSRDPLRLTLDPPEGFAVGHIRSTTPAASAGTFTIYGSGDRDHPFDDGDLRLDVLTQTRGVLLPGSTPTSARGRDATIERSRSDGMTVIEILESDERILRLSSRSINVDELLELAESVEIIGDVASLPNAPSDLQELARGAELLEFGITRGWGVQVAPLPSADSPEGSSVDGSPEEAFFQLTGTDHSTETDLLLALHELGPTDRLDVRGQAGWLRSDSGRSTLIWTEDGSLLRFSAIASASPRTPLLLDFAERLDAVDTSTWDERVFASRAHADSGAPFNAVAELFDHQIDDDLAAEWWVYSTDGGQLCMDLEFSGGEAGSGCFDDLPSPGEDPMISFSVHLATVQSPSISFFALFPDEAVRIEVATPDRSFDAPLLRVDEDTVATAFVLVPGEALVGLRALDVDGTELWTEGPIDPAEFDGPGDEAEG